MLSAKSMSTLGEETRCCPITWGGHEPGLGVQGSGIRAEGRKKRRADLMLGVEGLFEQVVCLLARLLERCHLHRPCRLQLYNRINCSVSVPRAEQAVWRWEPAARLLDLEHTSEQTECKGRRCCCGTQPHTPLAPTHDFCTLALVVNPSLRPWILGARSRE